LKKVTYKYNIGDQVWLIHTQERAVVTDFVNMDMLKVVLANNIEVPVFKDDLVLFEIQHLNQIQLEGNITAEVETILPANFQFNGDTIPSGFYLSFLPVNVPFESPFFEMILVNDSNDDIVFDCKLFLQGELYMHLKNNLKKRYIYNLGDLALDELNENVSIEMDIQHKSNPLLMLQKKLKLKPKVFFKELCSTPILNQSTYCYKLGFMTENVHNVSLPLRITPVLTRLIQNRIKENKPKGIDQLHKHYFVADIIDLHIENLVANTRNMTNAEIIKIQLQRFEESLEMAILYKLPKFTVVHGLGKGTLKLEINKVLKEYKVIRSYKNELHHKYGFGATEIFFK
jgi:hypothetical protein